MQDVFYALVVIIFFAISASFTRGCEKLYKDEANG
jgi:hypothetical protein